MFALDIGNINVTEVIATITAILGFWGILKQTFPIETQWVLMKLGGNKTVFRLMTHATTLVQLTDDKARRQWVADQLVEMGATPNQADQMVALLYKKWLKK